ncbi:MAG: hypothetical protein M3O36_21900, partial [Myxococcota bacterium]|nr:hypothetical protein [Myxococcota bacterium]
TGDGGGGTGDDGGPLPDGADDVSAPVVDSSGISASGDAAADGVAGDASGTCPTGRSKGACLMTPAPGTTACTDYTGSSWAANAGGCGTGGGGPGTVVTACPTTNLVGRCGFNCGTPQERIAFAYAQSGVSAAQQMAFCAAAPGGKWLGK